MIFVPAVSRGKAAAIHLAISAAFAAATLAVMLALWYPPPLFAAMGGTELAMLIVGVDVAIGPLMTLIVFDRKKKELLFDLAVIATLQLAALVYGIHAMHAGRPVFAVFVEDRFFVVSAAELETEAVAKAGRPEFRTLSLTGPKWVAADMPADPKVVEDILFAGFAGLGAQNLPQYFVPCEERRRQILARALPLDQLGNISPAETALLDKALARSGRAPGQVRYLPVLTKRMTMIALIDRGNGALIEVMQVDPGMTWLPLNKS